MGNIFLSRFVLVKMNQSSSIWQNIAVVTKLNHLKVVSQA